MHQVLSDIQKSHLKYQYQYISDIEYSHSKASPQRVNREGVLSPGDSNARRVSLKSKGKENRPQDKQRRLRNILKLII